MVPLTLAATRYAGLVDTTHLAAAILPRLRVVAGVIVVAVRAVVIL